MVQKVHGGILAGTNLTGHLQYLKIEVASVDVNPQLPNSVAEQVYRTVSLKSTLVIIEFDTGVMHVAVENAGDGWTKADLEAALTAAGLTGTVTVGKFTVV
ncbi:hypothetical protein MIJ3_00074 [Pseudomonas phage vB_PaeM_MIJ3]|nr:hypothetical protein Deiofobo_0030 [Pseudomonas phage Deifobo]VOH53912.1 hypothetical protein MIJ3_00074 [Pseudomonas phage vB_PaeM_MIJ3]